MYKDWRNTTKELSRLLGEVGNGAPDVSKSFSALAKAASTDGALSPGIKELMAIAIGIAERCDGCIAFHAKAAVRHGVTREELLETIGMSVYMGGGPSYIYGAQALEAFDQFAGD